MGEFLEDWTRIYLTVLGFVIAFIYIPHGMYWTYKLWTHRFHTALAKRRVSISFIQIGFIFLFMLMEAWWNWMLPQKLNPVFMFTTETELADWIIWCFGLHGLIWTSAWKFWLLYYDMRWLIASHRKQWHRVINPKSVITASASRVQGLISPVLAPMMLKTVSNGSQLVNESKSDLNNFNNNNNIDSEVEDAIDAIKPTSAPSTAPTSPHTLPTTNDQKRDSKVKGPNLSRGSGGGKSVSKTTTTSPRARRTSSVFGSETDDSVRSQKQLLFYLQYKGTLGSMHRTAWIVSFLVILFSGLQIFAAYYVVLSEETKHVDEQTAYGVQAIISFLSFICAFTFLSYLRWKLMSLKFEDSFYVAVELKYLFRILTFYMICHSIHSISNYTINNDESATYNSKHKGLHVIYVIWSTIRSFSFYALWVLHTHWVCRKLSGILESRDSGFYSRKDHSVGSKKINFEGKGTGTGHTSDAGTSWRSATAREIDNIDKIIAPMLKHNLQELERDPTSRQITINQMISHKRGIDIFMQLLAKEFSVECLLSVVEFLQYQNYIFNELSLILEADDEILVDMDAKLLSKKYHIELPYNIPLSDAFEDVVLSAELANNDINDTKIIVEDSSPDSGNSDNNNNKKGSEYNSPITPITPKTIDDIIKNSKKISFCMYKKYVEIGANYEINIQSRTRKALSRLMANEQIWSENEKITINDMFHLFDQSTKEMIVLLNGSFTRFQATLQYKKFKSTFFS